MSDEPGGVSSSVAGSGMRDHSQEPDYEGDQLPSKNEQALSSSPVRCRGTRFSGERAGGGSVLGTVSSTLPFEQVDCGASSPKESSLLTPVKVPGRAHVCYRKIDGILRIRRVPSMSCLRIPVDDTVLAQPLCHVVDVTVGGRVICRLLGHQTAWSLGVVNECCARLPLLRGTYAPECPGELCAYDWGKRSSVGVVWESSERGGVYDSTIKEELDSLISRVGDLERSAARISQDLCSFRSRLLKRSREEEDQDSGGARGSADHPQLRRLPEGVLGQGNQVQPVDALLRTSDDQGRAHRDDAQPVCEAGGGGQGHLIPPWRESSRADEGENEVQVVEDDEDPQFDHEVIIQFGVRARRRYNLSYIEPNATIGDVHFEAARVTKRGALTFELQQHGQTLSGTTVLHTLGRRICLDGISRAAHVRHLSPRSAMRRGGMESIRGGAPSSLRARISRRLVKHGCKVPEILQLVQSLWPREARAFTEHSGSAQSLEDMLQTLIKRHGAIYTKDGWILDGGAPMQGKVAHDPWLVADPWSASRGSTQSSSGFSATQHALDDAASRETKEFEQYELVTRNVKEDGQELVQMARTEYQAGKEAVVMVVKEKVANLLALVDGTVSVMIITNAWHKKLHEAWNVVKTQIVVKAKASTKALTAYAAAAGKAKVHAVQQAVRLQVIESQTIVGTIRLRKAVCSEEIYEAVQKKENLVKIIGPLINSVTLTMKRMEENPPAVRWSFEVARMHLAPLLKCSGECEAVITVDRAEENKLGVIPVFVSATAASVVLRQLEGIPHLGVTGPTKSGHFVARADESQLEKVRKAVLGSTSSFADQWTLQVKHKYVGRFLRRYSSLSVVESLKTTLKWPCIAISSKTLSKTHHTVVVGSTDPPPYWQVELGGEVVILQELEAPQQDKLATAFSAPQAAEARQAEGHGELPDAPQSALDQLCDMKVKVMEQQIEQKIMSLKDEVKTSVEAAATGVLQRHEKDQRQEWDKRDQLMGQLKEAAHKQEAQIQEHKAVTKVAFEAMERKLESMEQTNQQQFEKVERTLAEQAQALTTSTQSFKAELQMFGADLMKQIVQMQAEASGSSKKRKPDDAKGEDGASPGEESNMDTRGGMNEASQDYMKELADRLRRALTRHGLQGMDAASSLAVEEHEAAEQGYVEEKGVRSSKEEQSVVPQQPTCREVEVTRSEPPSALHAKEGQEVTTRERRNKAEEGSEAPKAAEAACSSEKRGASADVAVQVGEACVLQNGGGQLGQGQGEEKATRSPPVRREHHPALREQGKSIKCSESTCQDVATFLSDRWEEAMRLGAHIWTLKKGPDMISEIEPIQHLQHAIPAKILDTYHIACWTCGLVYAASRRKAVQGHGCYATVLAVGGQLSKRRATGRSCSQAVYEEHLQSLNKQAARSAKHWPRQCETPPGATNGPWFECEKCGFRTCNSKKMRLIEGTCDRQLHRAMQVLPGNASGPGSAV